MSRFELGHAPRERSIRPLDRYDEAVTEPKSQRPAASTGVVKKPDWDTKANATIYDIARLTQMNPSMLFGMPF